MYCNSCGNQIPEGQSYCSVCGAQVTAQNQQPQMQYEQPQMQYQQSQMQYQQSQMQYEQPQMQYQQSQMQYQQPQMQYQQPQMQYQQPQGQYNPNASQLNGTALNMGWFKFIIYFQLFANALLNLITAIRVWTGSFYKSDGHDMSDMVYAYFDGLKGIDMAYGVGIMLLAVGAIAVRFMLSGYKSYGPISYHILILMNIVIPVIYLFALSNTMGVSLGEVITSEMGSSMAGSIILLIVNIIYFKERKHLFVN